MFEATENRSMFAGKAIAAPTLHDAGKALDNARLYGPAPIYTSARRDSSLHGSRSQFSVAAGKPMENRRFELSPQASRIQFSAATAKLVENPRAELSD